MSSFGVDYGFDGKRIQPDSSINVLEFSLDNLHKLGLLTTNPNLVKIDVDGIEHLILEGAKETLSHPECYTVLVEVNDDFKDQSQKACNILISCGFIFKEKKQSVMFVNNPESGATYNQIWIKK
tara:strand:- start:894 stop:1265 length:372 start_codon:yes stop_codon:yes gene_type:complete